MDGEIIIEGKRRRSWPDALKRKIVEESCDLDVTVCEVARRHDLDPGQLFAWRKKFRVKPIDQAAFIPVELGDAPCSPLTAYEDRVEIDLKNAAQQLLRC